MINYFCLVVVQFLFDGFWRLDVFPAGFFMVESV
jgi:hypothetical protein